MSKKQTAVDWFMSQLAISSQMSLVHDGVYKQAKELEKQQIKDAFGVGWEVGYNDEITPSYLTAEKYIEITFE